MTQFLTATELANHLTALVDDDEFVTRTVRVHFPEYGRDTIQAERAERAARQDQLRRVIEKEEIAKSLKAEPQTYVLADQSERQVSRSMEMGSAALLKALWTHHGKILHHFKLNGQQVMYL